MGEWGVVMGLSRAYSPHFRSVIFSGIFCNASKKYLEYFALKSLCFQQLAGILRFGTALATRRSARSAATKRQAGRKEAANDHNRTADEDHR